MISFRMIKINVSQFAILADAAPEDNLTYTVGLRFLGASEAKRVACEFTVEFAHLDKPIVKLAMLCEFDILPTDWDERIKDNAITLTKDELGFFANQTVGVARGVMFCKTEGTPFSHFIVPPVNLVSLITEDFTIKIEE